MNLNQSDTENDHLAGDLMVGEPAIKAFLIQLGMPEDIDVYYLRRAGSWPIGNTNGGVGGGGRLIASKRRLRRYADKITRGRAHIDRNEFNTKGE
jgi:hypothetical protein